MATEAENEEILKLANEIRAASRPHSMAIIMFALADFISKITDQLEREADPQATADMFLDHLSTLICIARTDLRSEPEAGTMH